MRRNGEKGLLRRSFPTLLSPSSPQFWSWFLVLTLPGPFHRASPMAQWLKKKKKKKKSARQCRRSRFNPWVRKMPLEKGMAAHASILAWRIPWAEEPEGLQSTGSRGSDTRAHMRSPAAKVVQPGAGRRELQRRRGLWCL